MPLQPYSTGTVGVANDSTAVSGAGVLWQPASVVQGDLLFVPSQNAFGVIEAVNDTYDGITLYQPWSGATASGLAYLILPSSWQRYDPALTQAMTRQLLALLSGAGVIYYVTGTAPDPGLATNDGLFAVKISSGTWTFWVSQSGAWVSLGSPMGLDWQGPWSSTVSYLLGAGVSRLGAAYIAVQPSLDQPPEAPLSAPVTISIASPGVVTWDNHGLAANTALTLATTGALPTGLQAATAYYVLNPTTNTFQLSASPGGGAINTSGTQSGTQTATVTYWEEMAAGGDRYDIAAFATDQPASGKAIAEMIFTTAVAFDANLPQSQAKAGTPATAAAVFSLQQNGTQFGTLTFAVAATAGVFASASGASFNAGDVLTVVAPSPRDATLANLAFTLTGYR